MTEIDVAQADEAVRECYICRPMEKWTQYPLLPPDLVSFLMELWWYHEDMGDDTRCYYALDRARSRLKRDPQEPS